SIRGWPTRRSPPRRRSSARSGRGPRSRSGGGCSRRSRKGAGSSRAGSPSAATPSGFGAPAGDPLPWVPERREKMARQILMPQAGQSMTEGRIVRWLVKEGAPVQKGEPILEIETDKANMEVEAPEAGVLSAVLHREGDVVAVLEPLA